jgi:hypothetical protein
MPPHERTWELVGGSGDGDLIALPFGVCRIEVASPPLLVAFDEERNTAAFTIYSGTYAAHTARDVADGVLRWQGWNQ